MVAGDQPIHWKHNTGHAWCGAPVDRCGGGTKVRSTDVKAKVTCKQCLANFGRSKPTTYGGKAGR